MKKTLAILLTLALVICMMPASAFAETTGTATLTDSMVNLSATSVLYNGQNLRPNVIVKTADGAEVDSSNYTVSWTQNGAPVSEVKTVGTYDVKVTSVSGNVFADARSVTKTFTITKVDFSNAIIKYTGSTKLSDFSGFTQSNVGDTVPLEDNKIDVKIGSETVAPNLYNVTATKKSSNEIQVKVEATVDDGNTTGTRYETITLTIELTAETYKVVGTTDCKAIPTQTYTGGALEPTVYVVPNGATSTYQTALIEGVDYKKSYQNNTNGNTDATVLIEGMGKYSGKITGTFHINGKSIANVSASAENAVQYQKPVLNITDGSKKLVEGVDYENVTNYDSNTIGYNKGTVTIYGKGNYTGQKKITYTVGSELKSSDVQMRSGQSTYYNGSTQTAAVTVKNVGSGNYRIEYRYTNKDGKAMTTTVPSEAYDYSVYVVGTGLYAGEILAGTYSILAVPLDWAEIVLGSTVYDTASGAYVPKVSVRHISGKFYFPETDFDVVYKNVDARYSWSKPTVVVTVSTKAVNLTTKNSGKTQLTKEFSVATRSISNCTVNFSDYRSSSAYTGSAIKPTVVVRDTSLNRNLTLNSDYTVTYKNAAGAKVLTLKDAGTYTVVVEGIGAYSGTQTLTYTITGTDISNYTVTLREPSVKADGFAKIPVITSVAYSYYSKLSVNDYTVSYQDSTGKTVTRMSAPGTYKVVVTGKNGYSGSCYATFTIVGLAQSVTGVKDAYKVYPTTDTFKLYPQVTEGRITYTSSDASVASVDAYGYVTPHKAGRAVITISTTGNVKYDPASKNVVIKVYPNKAKMSQKPWNTGKKGQIKVRWNKQDNVTRYQVIYSRNKSFKKGSYKVKGVNAAVNSYTTQSTTVSGLYSGYTYYVKVRAIKYVYNDYGQKQIYYGNWSNWRSVKVK